ncbi:pyrimidine-nucleoside phosphorylase [Marinicrinis lubricantis]|uniref:Pyrimidine-nucleoside phosphorylase n=1 Tax=Marinicrinis lubricantis TaxID=2086470 RepID=A0ABW1ISQ0_9BACL
MRTVDIIHKKRAGQELSREEIQFLIDGYVRGTIPDYQISACLMAVCFQGMSAKETADLTMVMAESGDQMDLSSIAGIKVDKHSTGGVGDTTTLVLAPLVAAAGVPVAKMSGRGLGHTGGTIDKLEAIPGFAAEQSKEHFLQQVREKGVSVISQSGNITPADKKLYALRDVTATVESIPLIASSIMSKKIASGADAIVLDVKTGDGAFMKTTDDSIELAKAMVAIGTEVGRDTIALITGMDQPLGFAIGNALEVKEAIHTLKGEGPEDLTELCLELGAHMLVLGQKAEDVQQGKEQLKQLIASGEALNRLKEFIAAQGGDRSVIDDPERLPKARVFFEVRSPTSGYIHSMEAEEIGICAMMLGAGRETKEADIDLAVGIELKKKIGDAIQMGDVLAVLHANSEDAETLQTVKDKLLAAYTFSDKSVEKPPLIYAVVTKDGIEYR